MCSQKRAPRHRPLAARRNALGFQDRGDGRPRDAMPEILQGTLDACVAPAGILAGHPYDQPADLHEHPRPSRLTPRVRPFLDDELPVPPEDRVGRDVVATCVRSRRPSRWRGADMDVIDDPHDLRLRERIGDERDESERGARKKSHQRSPLRANLIRST